jgi:prolyl oligopeptidase
MKVFTTLALLAGATLAPALCCAQVTPPAVARTVDAADDAFGLHLPDPYRWMEGKDNAEFSAWLKSQGTYGRAQLDALPRLTYWRDRLAKVAQAGTINRLQRPMGGRVFFLRLQQGREGVFMVRDPDGHERVLFDPGSGTAGASVTEYSPSPDGRLVAINVQHGGSEVTRVQLLNVGDAKPLADVIDDVWGEFAVNWLPDGSAFTYTQLQPAALRDATDPLTNERVRLHRLGTASANDPVLFVRGSSSGLSVEPSEFPSIDPSQRSPYAVLVLGGARAQIRLCLAPRTAALRANAPWRCPIGYDDNVQQVALAGDRLYWTTMRDHPNGQVMTAGIDKSGKLGPASVLQAEDPGAVVTGLAAAKDALYLKRMQGGPEEILRAPYPSGKPVKLQLPYAGSIYQFGADPRAAGVVFTLQDWTRPRTAYRVRGGHAALEDLKLGADSPTDYSGIVSEEVTARSADGTEVPLSIIRRRDARPGNGEIAILEGYGGYGISEPPFFDPLALEWVAAGHIYAVAHVRGGGEKGDKWRVGGTGANKERGVEDFVACAESLIQRGWTGRGRVVAFGGSMGGVLVGGAMTRSPDLFGAVVIQSGELNPSRLLAAQNGANQFAEVGDPATSAGLHAVAAMDPYLRIKPGTAYPPVLLIVGLNDNRVQPWASGKFGARLLAVGSGGKPVWYRTDDAMGHFNTAQGTLAMEDADFDAFSEAMIAH